MKALKNCNTVLVCLAGLGLSACSNFVADKSQTGQTGQTDSPAAIEQINTMVMDSISKQKTELTQLYTQAIAEFIKAANKMNKANFDTLFFGKHVYGQADDFPDIELPQTIENTYIKLIAPDVGEKKQQTRKSLVYVNMMGWVNPIDAEFILVVFSNGAAHQYDYFLNFKRHSRQNKFELDRIYMEYYSGKEGRKPERMAIYENGKFTGPNN